MIVRERQDTFILIEQAKHAVLAHDIFSEICKDLITDDPDAESLLTAIKYHDEGWHYVDQACFWNDMKEMPYHFLDFPSLAKIPFYHYGITLTTQIDPYAAALSSAHYVRFLAQSEDVESKYFVKNEKRRQAELLAGKSYDKFEEHFAMLRLADNLSLFLCLNEPNVSQENVHYFFKNGISVPEALHKKIGERIHFDWHDKLILTGFNQPTTYQAIVPYKAIKKATLAKENFAKVYAEVETKYTKIAIQTV